MTKPDSEIKQLVESIKRGTLYLGGIPLLSMR